MSRFSKVFILIVIIGISLGFPGKEIRTRRSTNDVKNQNLQENELSADEGKAEALTNPLSGFQQWLAGSSGGGSMVLGTYQALLMPMPQGQDLTSGITNVAQGIQGLFQG